MALLQKENILLHVSLSNTREMTYEVDTLKIVYTPTASFHYRMLGSEEQNELAKFCKKIRGIETKVEVILKDKEEVSTAQKDPIKDPAVQQFLKAFPGKYVVENDKKE